jgi:hypothetical protein
MGRDTEEVQDSLGLAKKTSSLRENRADWCETPEMRTSSSLHQHFISASEAAAA